MRVMFQFNIRRRLYAGLGALCLAPACLAAEPPATIVVFDGSGSMWGKLDGEKQTKLVLARDALKANMAKLKPDARMGLASFGHRRGADCTDVQVIVSPEAGTAERINTVLDKHNPRGKGPLTTALKEAAKALGSGTGPKSLILIHDDPDNCQQDACAALGEIQASAPSVQISVIGLGLRKEEAQRLMCLTKPTGGKLIDAQNADQIASGIDEAVRLALLDGAPQDLVSASASVVATPVPVVATPALVPPVPQRAPLAETGPPALRLAALLSPGAMPHPHSVRWSVTPEAAGAMAAFTGSGQDVLVPLPAGAYIIEAQDGLVRATQKVTVRETGHTSGDIILNAGVLRLRLTAGRDATSAALTTITIFEAGTGAVNARLLKPIGVLTGREDSIALPAASYLIRLQRGPQVVERPMTIAAGRTDDLDLALNTARLTLNLAASPQLQAQAQSSAVEPAPMTLFTIFEDDPDVPKGRREVTRSVAPEPDFILAPGTYYVVARQGRVEARERVTLNAGEAVRKTLALFPARLKLSSKLVLAQPAPADARDQGTTPIGYRVERLDVVPAETFTVNEAVATLLVPAGRYRIEARHGRVNARASRELTIGPGESQDVVLEPKAGIAQFRLGAEASASAADIFWEVRDDTGRPVWTTVQWRPSAILSAGRYMVAAETRDKRYQQTFEIRAGEQRTIEVAN
jgi:Ca-activated chloride channel homolog